MLFLTSYFDRQATLAFSHCDSNLPHTLLSIKIMTEEKETYRGNCRCAAFVFEVTIPKIKEVEICKCSICYKKNYAFLFVDKKDLRVVKGSMEDFTTYTFGEGIMKHMFCPKCSMMTVCTHDKFPDQYVVNVSYIHPSSVTISRIADLETVR